MSKRGVATGVVVLVALAAGGVGGLYLWKEAFPTDTSAQSDGGARDASADARAGRGKPKLAKKGTRPGTRRPRGGPHAPRPAGGNQPGGNQPGGNPPGGGDDGQDEGFEEEVAEPFHPPFVGRGPAGPTYEAAIASNKQEINMGGRATPDLTDAQIAGPMHSGGFVGECGAPDNMKVTVKVAIKQGHAAGVSVSTSPPDPDIAGCIDRYVRTFSWPSSSKMDSFTTTY